MLAGNVLTYYKTNKTKSPATHAGRCCLGLRDESKCSCKDCMCFFGKSKQGTAKMPHADIQAFATICSISSCTYTSFNFRMSIIIIF